ncbi:pyruvate dehydrogenase (acetyl-transferring) E1 component subunit alpha [Microbacterium sp. F2E]|uniref:pyruvate dehydrogenase (acetyl-transferring) E1 component subunit alpha n=1 Tax=Microbacterium sp. F2E TaxID=2895284 RepID=UPI001E56260D|nr:pyruvate dehydrogenase (acetyl-transferring) E1 component subunit alpha [Microbacterium sp. F2E]MCC9053429.1 pyruvate dehydrogenase (acetyl-transferring) E1 component subunit alpha [Microbacterium sp. F2E]
MHTLTTDPMHAADTDSVAQLLTPTGDRIADPRLDAWVDGTGAAPALDAPALRALYRDMAITRRLDGEGVALQRQGHLGLWAPAQGQEAIQVASARACRGDDFLFPSYRELGVLVTRGASAAELVLGWRGEVHGTFDPYALHVATPQIIIGAQSLHAVGYAMGIQRDGADQVAVAYFGDGATSQGDVNEAMVFASSFRAPVVFVCSNNQWAISEPVSVQSRFPIAGRAPAFGIPSMRVDGNDAIACTAAMRWALDRARSGEGPAFIEAVTYRMGPHTTSDDPTRYREASELELWRSRDPLTRLEAHLRRTSAWDDAFADEVAAAGDALAAGMREAALTAQSRPAIEVFDDVYAEPHVGLGRQRERFAAYLDGFADEEV